MRLIEERHNKYKEISKKCLTNKLSDKREKFELSHEKYLLSRKMEDELRDEKIFKKFEGYVSDNIIIYIYINMYIYSIL